MNEEFNLELLGKGAIPDIFDERDYKAEDVMGAVEPVDWNIPFQLPEPPNENQNSSDSCVSQSTSYLHWQLKGKNYSRRDLFSRIALEYGAQLRDGVKQICTTGQQTRDECVDPTPETPENMRIKSDKPDSAGMDDQELNYYVITGNNIDLVAQGIRDHKGVIFGVTGDNVGWSNPDYPIPPKPGAQTWGHALYGFGYGLKDGKKYILAKSSWCNTQHHVHYITQDYFEAGMTFNAWVVIPKIQETMTNSIIVKKDSEYGMYDPATSADGLITLMRNRGIQPPLNADGTLNWDAVNGMVGGTVVPKN